MEVTAGVNVVNGLVTWTLQTIDPATGQTPTNPELGLLPPDDAEGDGEGTVSYTIQAKSGVATGTTVAAQATVIFDTNAPINTPVVANTIDAVAPTSTVQALPAQTDDTSFEVSWSGTDDTAGSGTASYTIMVSEDGGAPTVWLANTTRTNAIFAAQTGHNYAFSSIATDNAGNQEAPHAAPDTTIQVGTPSVLSISADDPVQAVSGSGTTSFTFTVTRTGDTSQAQSAAWAVSGTDQHPAAASDFVGGALPTGTVNFAPGDTSATITVPVAANSTVRPDDDFAVSLSAPTNGASLGTVTANATIEFADATLSIFAANADQTQLLGGVTPFAFTVSRTGDTSDAQSATWSVIGSGATPVDATDFVGDILPSGTVTFAAGDTSEPITVDVTGIAFGTTERDFAVTLAAPTNRATLGFTSANGAILSDNVPAAPILSVTTLNLGAVRVGGSGPTAVLGISDGTTANPYQQSLSYAVTAPAGFAVNSNGTGTIVSGGSAIIGLSLLSGTAGDFSGSQISVALTSLGRDGASNQTLTSRTVTVNGKVYATATPQVASSLNFGIVHVGENDTGTLTITNAASGALTDMLVGGVGALNGAGFNGSGSLGAGITAGSSGNLDFALSTGTAGVFSGSATLSLYSHDTDLTDQALTVAPVTLAGTIDNFATAAVVEVSGSPTLTQNGTNYLLDFGQVTLGSTPLAVELGAKNVASVIADTLKGSFIAGGDPEIVLGGFSNFAGVAAGTTQGGLDVTLNTGTAGVFSQQITLDPTGYNTSGYSGTLAPEVITITGTVAGSSLPVITGSVSGQTTTDETPVMPFSQVVISDAGPSQTETVTVTMGAVDGTFSDSVSGTVSAGGVYLVTGAASTVTAALQALTFTPTPHQVAPGQTVTTTFTITDIDTAGATASDTNTLVTATAVADPPVIGGTIASQPASDEASITPFANVTITQLDVGQTETVTVAPSIAANGVLSDPNAASDGAMIDAQGVWHITGTAAQVTTAIEALVFTPTAHQVAPGATVTTSFTLTDTDTAGATASNGTTSVVAKAAADAPVIAGTIANQPTSDQASIAPFANVTITQIDVGQTETVTVAPSSTADGVLSDPNAASDHSTIDANGVWHITGTAAQVTAALDALRFVPTAHQVAPGNSVTTSFTITDTDTAGATASDATTSVIATAATDQPVIGGIASLVTTTDEASVDPFATATITDVDFGQTETLTAAPANPANGVLTDPNASSDGSFVNNSGAWVVSGSAAAVQAALRGLVFTPTAHQVAPGQSVSTQFTITDTNTAGSTASPAMVTVDATAVKDTPTITGTVHGQTTPNTAPIMAFSSVTIGDVDFGQTETVTVTPSTTTLGALTDSVAGSVNASGVYTVTGTATQVTTTLDALTFTPKSGLSAGGTVNFTIADVNTAGASASDSNTSVAVTIATTNLSITGTRTGLATTDESKIRPFAGVTITDTASGQTETVTITPTSTANGTLADPNKATDGDTISYANGVYKITGTAAKVTTWLRDLVFTPVAHEVAPGQTVTTGFTLAVTDSPKGFTVTDTKTSVATTAVADKPTITGAVAGQATTDEAAISPLKGIVIADVDVGQTETVTVSLSNATNGILSDPHIATDGGKIANGVYTVSGTNAQVTAAVDGLVFTPTAHQVAPFHSVTTTITVKATDTAGKSASNSQTTVIATAVKDTPTISGVTAKQTTLDNDPINLFAGVTVTDVDHSQTETIAVTPSSTANGTLVAGHGGSVNHTTGVFTVTGSAATVTTALQALRFLPLDHEVAPGQPVTTTFTVSDTNTAGASAASQATAVTVTAAKDAPMIAGVTAASSTSDLTAVKPFKHVTITEPDFGQTETVTVTPSAKANGVLSDTAGGSVNATTGAWTLTGSASVVTAAIEALTFAPTAHQAAPGSTVATSFTIGVVDTAGASATSAATTVTATAAKDAPTITGTVHGQTATDADVIKPFANVTIGEVDFGQTETVTITPSSDANGVLSGGGGMVSTSTGVWSFTGTAAQVTAAIDAVRFTPTLHQVAAGRTVTTGFTVGVTDTAGATASNSQTTVVTTATHAITGTSGNETLAGTTGADLFDGKGGNDIEVGGGGYDTYLFNGGYGTLQIVNGGGSTTVLAAQLTLGLGLDQTDLWFIHSGNNLTIDELGTTQSITVDNWFASPAAQLKEIMGGDGAWLDTAAVAPLVSAMTAFQTANPSFNPTANGTAMPTDATLHVAIASAWHT